MSPTEATSFDVGGYLSEAHAALIRASAISDSVRDERGYRTIDTPEELLEFGFSGLAGSTGARTLPAQLARGRFQRLWAVSSRLADAGQ